MKTAKAILVTAAGISVLAANWCVAIFPKNFLFWMVAIISFILIFVFWSLPEMPPEKN